MIKDTVSAPKNPRHRRFLIETKIEDSLDLINIIYTQLIEPPNRGFID